MFSGGRQAGDWALSRTSSEYIMVLLNGLKDLRGLKGLNGLKGLTGLKGWNDLKGWKGWQVSLSFLLQILSKV